MPAPYRRFLVTSKLLFLRKYIRDVLIEMFVIIGSSGGTTEVIIRMHLRNSLFLSLSASFRPSFNTYRDEAILRIRSIPRRMKASVCFREIFSLLKMTDLDSLPFAVSKPVLSTYATQPLSGGSE